MKNGTNRNNSHNTKRTKLANAVATKRGRGSVDNAIDPTILRNANDVESIAATEPTDINESGSDTGNAEQLSSGSGSDDRGNGRGTGTGNDDSGSGSDTPKRRRGRPTGTTNAAKLDSQGAVQRVKRPRKVLDDLEDGVEASVLLISAAFQTASELFAVTTKKDYMAIQRDEANELAKATKQCLDQLPKTARKRFDQLMGKYYPFYNLAVVATKIAYPRYKLYEMELQLKNEGQNQANERTNFAEHSEFSEEFIGNPLN